MSPSLGWGRAIVTSYVATLGGLLLGTVVGNLLLLGFDLLDGQQGWNEPQGWADALKGLRLVPLLALMAMLFGGLPALILGAPLYAALLVHDLADYLTAAALGAALGTALAGMYPVGLVFGPCVACATHFVANRLLRGWLRPAAIDDTSR